LDGGFAHTVEGVTAGFGWWALIYQVAQNRGGSKNSEVDIIERL